MKKVLFVDGLKIFDGLQSDEDCSVVKQKTRPVYSLYNNKENDITHQGNIITSHNFRPFFEYTRW